MPPPDLILDLLLLLFEKERGSADLADALGELRGREVPLATFYRQLQKAVDQGWVEALSADQGSAPTPDRGTAGTARASAARIARASAVRIARGRPGRSYRITGPGETILRAGVAQQQRRVSRALASGLLMEMS